MTGQSRPSVYPSQAPESRANISAFRSASPYPSAAATSASASSRLRTSTASIARSAAKTPKPGSAGVHDGAGTPSRERMRAKRACQPSASACRSRTSAACASSASVATMVVPPPDTIKPPPSGPPRPVIRLP